MISNLPVVRSPAARAVFLISAILTACILVWIRALRTGGETHGLTPIFYVLFAFFDYPATLCALLILLCASLFPERLNVTPLLRWTSDHAALVGLGSTLALCAGSLLVYHNHPLSMDEYAPFFQSQTFAAGHLTGSLPAPLLDWLIPQGFQDYFLNVSRVSGAVASNYWPSFALLLTPFTWLGIPWACNPVISGLTVVAVHRLTLQIFENAEAAGAAVLFTIASPVFFADGISYYAMSAHLLANTVYALLLVRPNDTRACAAGLVGSVALTLHNPVPHMLFALPWIIWLARRQGGLRLVVRLVAGYAPLCVLLGIGWFWLGASLKNEVVGAAGVAGHTAGLVPALSVIAQAFSPPSATLLLARLIGLAKVWVWSVPGLLLLAGVGAWKWRRNAPCGLLVASALLTFAGYLLVPMDQGHGWGFRYFHSAWMALPVLAAAALTRMPGNDASGTSFEAQGVRTFFVACVLLSLTAAIGYRALQMRDFIAADLQQVPAYSGTEDRIIIIDTSHSFYGADLVQNDPWMRGHVVRMVSNGRDEDAIMMSRFFPDLHQVYTDRWGTVWSEAPTRGPSPQSLDPAQQGMGAR